MLCWLWCPTTTADSQLRQLHASNQVICISRRLPDLYKFHVDKLIVYRVGPRGPGLVNSWTGDFGWSSSLAHVFSPRLVVHSALGRTIPAPLIIFKFLWDSPIVPSPLIHQARAPYALLSSFPPFPFLALFICVAHIREIDWCRRFRSIPVVFRRVPVVFLSYSVVFLSYSVKFLIVAYFVAFLSFSCRILSYLVPRRTYEKQFGTSRTKIDVFGLKVGIGGCWSSKEKNENQ